MRRQLQLPDEMLCSAAIRAIAHHQQMRRCVLAHFSQDMDAIQYALHGPKVRNMNQEFLALRCVCERAGFFGIGMIEITIDEVSNDADFVRHSEDFDGVFVSNGPGDPVRCEKTIAILKKAMSAKKPIFGICLGSQLMALSIGAKTFKLKYGHRGHNQPCIHLPTERCYLTSQNHGYAIDEKSLPKSWRVSFRNLNDESVEGIEHTSLPFFSVQFHPEASPGPTDNFWLFEKFYSLL